MIYQITLVNSLRIFEICFTNRLKFLITTNLEILDYCSQNCRCQIYTYNNHLGSFFDNFYYLKSINKVTYCYVI